MTTQTTNFEQTGNHEFNLLRTTLRANAIFSDVSGLVMLLASGWLSKVTGIEPPVTFLIIGVGLLGYALWLWFNSRSEEIAPQVVWAAIICDILWVVGSFVLLIGGFLPLTIVGKWVVVIIADIVGIFAVMQYIGLRRATK